VYLQLWTAFCVVAIFTLGQIFPCNLLGPTYSNSRKKLVPRTELERRENYMVKLYSQIPKGHPLLQMIEQCLKNCPQDRPTISQVVNILKQAQTEVPKDESVMSKLELMQTVRQRNKLIESKEKELSGNEQQFTLIWQANRAEIKRLQEQNQSQKEEIASLRQKVRLFS